ncbi:MAG TPA: hypothetical protein VGI03_05820 [Verrucomicrobiae bacterium]|jgi:hypothetical protein
MNWFSTIARALTGGPRAACLLFLVLLSGLFYGVFLPGYTLFSNDGPLSELVTQSHHLPERFTGCWQDLNNVGFNGGSAVPDISFGLQWLLGPVLFSKSYAIISLLILGMSAWLFFRQSRLAPLACSLGALAAILNSTFFSVAAWGISAHVLTIALFFLAMAALLDTSSPLRWLRVILAGFAVGMGVTEGADVGAIFSLYLGAFVIYQAWIAEGSRIKNLAIGIARLMVVAICALFFASQAIYGLVTTVEGVAVTSQQTVNTNTAQKRWDWATQWSLPKKEMLSLVVPGLFGDRLDTAGGGNYWGEMGRDALLQKYLDAGGQGTPPHGFLRYTGGGNYVGTLVVLIALWAAAQSLFRKNFVFNDRQRYWLWFWLAIAVFSLLLALGHYAPFYRLVYSLPYFSTIRNPTKYLYPFGVGMVALFAFGVDALQRRYMEMPLKKGVISRWAGFESWWKRASGFDKSWVYGCGLVWVASLAGWYIYAQHHDQLVHYLQFNRVGGNLDSVADYSIHHVGWFVVSFFLAVSLLILILSGAFVGKQSGGVLLAILLVADLGLANLPWITFWNYRDKYASNAVVDLLKDQPYEHRVAIAPVAVSAGKFSTFSQIYRVGWLQQQFPYYDIQSYDVVDMPRIPEDYLAFRQQFLGTNGLSMSKTRRMWVLENTRYVLGPANLVTYWNLSDPLGKYPLRPVMQFDMVTRPGVVEVTSPDQVTVIPSSEGALALFEFDGALPRASLFSRWQVDTNVPDVLNHIADPDFDPHSMVYMDGPPPTSIAQAANPASSSAGTVDYVHYAPKDILLKADATAPSVLLLNDHFDPNWKVFVDGQLGQLFRCNFLMRGVYLLPGMHQVEFKFEPPVGLLYVSVIAVGIGLLLLGLFIILVLKTQAPVMAPETVASVQAPAAKVEPKVQSPVAKIEPKPKSPPRPKAVSGRNGKR